MEVPIMTDQLLSLSGKHALVTGASSGIGAYIAATLDAAGANVTVHYNRNQAGADNVTSKLLNNGQAIQADLKLRGAVNALFDAAVEALGTVSILVNCAAEQTLFPLKDMSLESWSDMQHTNVDAVFQLSQLFAAQEQPGVIINISSIEGSRPAAGHSHYSTSKAALEMLTKAAAFELGPSNVRVNAVAPGLIWREGIEEDWPEGVNSWKKRAPLSRLGQPSDVANAVLFLASDAASFITGSVLTVDGGMLTQPGW
jgi:NAD(P)-dependent dehydrogenase (short-subunit alcohol dehydrogenase family)